MTHDNPPDPKKPSPKKNPWGKPEDTGRENNFGLGGGMRGKDPETLDLDEALRKLKEKYKNAVPAPFQNIPVLVPVLLGLAALWMASGFYVVNPGEQAVVQRFGAAAYTKAESGLGYHFPAPIESVNILNVQEIRKINVGFTEGENYRSGKAGKTDVPEESLILTSDRNIVDLNLEIQWNIKSAEDFLFNIQDQEGTIKKVAESAMREVVGQTYMFQIITNQRQQVADRAKAIIQQNLDEYQSGVNITQVLIQKAEVHPEVQDAFQDVQSAKQDAENVQNQAKAYREGILPQARGQAIQIVQEAQGYKQSTIAKASGDVQRFNAIHAAYLNGKDVTKERMYIETMEDVFKNAQKTILSHESAKNVVPYLPLEAVDKNAPPVIGTETKP